MHIIVVTALQDLHLAIMSGIPPLRYDEYTACSAKVSTVPDVYMVLILRQKNIHTK